MNEQMQRLSIPFEPRFIEWKPGSTTKDNTKCLAMAYGDTRAYQERLDEVFGWDWWVEYNVLDDKHVVCTLSVLGDGASTIIRRSATGEDTDLMSAEARAFKRACSAFGLGRYLYDLPSVWVEYDAQRRRITDDAKAKLDARYRTWYLQHAPDATQPQQAAQTAQDSGKAPRRVQTPQRPQNGVQRPVATPDVTADEVFGKDDKATEPWYVIARANLKNGVANFAEAAHGYHIDGGPPASAPQYNFLAGLLDTIVKDATGADDGHKRVLAVLCQSDISKDNPPSKSLASNLLDRLATHKKVDGVKVENDAYDQKVVDACVTIYRVAESVATPQLFEAA